MQISVKWVNELVNIENVRLENLIEKLTLGGFEVEDVKEIDENKILLEISATANRSDSLSIQGLALEISALVNQTPKILDYGTKKFKWNDIFQDISKKGSTNSDCLAFLAITVENLNTLVPPKWLTDKLIDSNLPPENNLSDFQKYILLETGYPFEIYDLDKIKSKLKQSEFELTLHYPSREENFIANNGINYELKNSTLVVKADEMPISIAGLIPSQETAYSFETKSLLIEGSIFNPATIRRQSRMLGLRTDRSARYEKSLKPTFLLNSFYRLISLLRISNPNLICKVHTNSKASKINNKQILLHYKHVIEILGPIQTNSKERYILPETITNSLERLNFKINYQKEKELWEVNIPEFRSDDIMREIDLIEEIGRLYGFNKFVTRLPKITRIGTEDSDYQTRKKLTSCFINLGLNELIQYSLVKEKTYIQNDIELLNPLIKDYSNLRSSLLPNLIKALEENIKQGNSILEGFEYGHIFLNINEERVTEQENIAGIFGGLKVKSGWSQSSKSLNWFEAKGRLENVFKKLNLVVYWKSWVPNEKVDLFHPYSTSQIYLSDGTELGLFGELHPRISQKLEFPKDIYLFELNFELIKTYIQKIKLPVYQEYSPYPKVIKDLSFIIKNDVYFDDLKTIFYLNGSKFLIEINLLDEYSGKTIPNNHTSLCLQLIFQSNQETLEKKTIEQIIGNLKNLLVTKFNATLRI